MGVSAQRCWSGLTSSAVEIRSTRQTTAHGRRPFPELCASSHRKRLREDLGRVDDHHVAVRMMRDVVRHRPQDALAAGHASVPDDDHLGALLVRNLHQCSSGLSCRQVSLGRDVDLGQPLLCSVDICWAWVRSPCLPASTSGTPSPPWALTTWTVAPKARASTPARSTARSAVSEPSVPTTMDSPFPSRLLSRSRRPGRSAGGAWKLSLPVG